MTCSLPNILHECGWKRTAKIMHNLVEYIGKSGEIHANVAKFCELCEFLMKMGDDPHICHTNIAYQ